MREVTIFRLDMFGKRPTPGYMIADFKVAKLVRYETYWTDMGYSTWRTRLKMPWNVIEQPNNN